jgi:tetratricopeptide (TPR) repeat protein
VTAHRFLLAALAIQLSFSSSAFAQESVARAEALFRAGRDAMRTGDYARACEQFRESDRLDPQPGTKLNLGGCEEKRGRLATALDLFRVVERELPAADQRAIIAKERVAAIDKRIPRVTFELAPDAPAGTVVRLGQVEMAKATLGVEMPLDPGSHEVVVSAAGFSEKRFSLDLAEGERRKVEVAPGPKEADGITSDPGPTPEPPASSNKTLAYVLGGVGIAGVVVGGVAGVMTLQKKSIADDNCDDALKICTAEGKDANDAGRTLGTISTVGFVVGALGLGAGAYFLLTDEGGKETALGVHPGAGGGFVSVRRAW